MKFRLFASLIVKLTLIFSIFSCSRNSSAISLLDAADSLMHSRPDSALALLDSIDPAVLPDRADRARYALLKSIALDKNYIDTTNFSVLQPAIDYYLTDGHGSPDDRLRTLYYQGVICLNAGDNSRAMELMLKASELKGPFADSIPLAQVYVLQSLFNIQQIKYPKAVYQSIYAAGINQRHSHEREAAKCYARALEFCIGVPKSTGDSLLDVCQSILISHPEYIDDMGLHIFSYLIDNGSTEDMSYYKDVVERNRTRFRHQKDVDYTLANAYNRLGDGQTAMRLIEKYNTLPPVIRHLLIRSAALENLQDYKSALLDYKVYVDSIHALESRIFSNDLFTAEKQYKLELEKQKQIQSKNRQIHITITVAVILLIITVISLLLVRILRLKRNLALQQVEIFQDKLNLLNETLKQKRDQTARRVSESLFHYLSSFNSLLIRDINRGTSDIDSYNQAVDQIKQDKELFIINIKEAINLCYPHFTEYISNYSFSDVECNVIYLCAIGLNIRQIQQFLQIGSAFNISSTIRTKLGLRNSDGKLPQYIRNLLTKI